jgi:hypothetical protein
MSWLVKTLTASDKSVASCSSDRSIRTMSMKNASSICSNEKTKNKLDIFQSKFSTSVTNYQHVEHIVL